MDYHYIRMYTSAKDRWNSHLSKPLPINERYQSLLGAIESNEVNDLRQLDLTYDELKNLFSILDLHDPRIDWEGFNTKLFWNFLLKLQQPTLDYLYSLCPEDDLFAAVMFNQPLDKIKEGTNAARSLPLEVLYAAIARGNIDAIQYTSDKIYKYMEHSYGIDRWHRDNLNPARFVRLYDKEQKTLPYLINCKYLAHHQEYMDQLFFLAVSRGNAAVVKSMLLKNKEHYGAIVDNPRYLHGNSALYIALENGDEDVYIALENGDEDVVEVLLENNAKCLGSSKPLHPLSVVIRSKDLDRIAHYRAVFARHKISMKLNDDDWKHAIDALDFKDPEHVEIIKYLLKYFPDFMNQGILFYKAKHNSDLFNWLVEMNAPMDVKYYGGTVLHDAARRGDLDIIEVYKEKCPQAFTIKDYCNHIPFQCVFDSTPNATQVRQAIYEFHKGNNFENVDASDKIEMAVYFNDVHVIKDYFAIPNPDSIRGVVLDGCVYHAMKHDYHEIMEILFPKLLEAISNDTSLRKAYRSAEGYLTKLFSGTIWYYRVRLKNLGPDLKYLLQNNRVKILQTILDAFQLHGIDTKQFFKKMPQDYILYYAAFYCNNQKPKKRQGDEIVDQEPDESQGDEIVDQEPDESQGDEIVELLLNYGAEFNLMRFYEYYDNYINKSDDMDKKTIKLIAKTQLKIYLEGVAKRPPDDQKTYFFGFFKGGYPAHVKMAAAQELKNALDGKDYDLTKHKKVLKQGGLSDIYSALKTVKAIRFDRVGDPEGIPLKHLNPKP